MAFNVIFLSGTSLPWNGSKLPELANYQNCGGIIFFYLFIFITIIIIFIFFIFYHYYYV